MKDEVLWEKEATEIRESCLGSVEVLNAQTECVAFRRNGEAVRARVDGNGNSGGFSK